LELHGTDFSAVAVARTQAYGFEARRAVLPDLPHPDNYFKCVVCTEVLEHLDDPVGSVRTFHRVLHPSGMLVVSVPQDVGPDDCEEHVQNFTEASLRECLEAGGFSVSSVEVVEREPLRKPGASFLASAVRKNHADRR
jgi:2-polyprenyl-3-methyl-5-hydroxy-6-metoxy-1,4-benzoquinol methylase